MRIIPAIYWYLERTEGSKVVDRLRFVGDWRLASIEGMGSPPVEQTTQIIHGLDGSIASSYSVQPRTLTLGVLFRGAKDQMDYYAGRMRLLDFVRPNQHIPVKLFIVLPTTETLYLDVFCTPGAPLPLPEDRGRTFLEPVSITAYNPFWQRETPETVRINIADSPTISVPNQATLAIPSDQIRNFDLQVNLGVLPGGEAQSGFWVQHKISGTNDNTYHTTDVGNVQSQARIYGLADDTTYVFKATAYNSAGDGSASAVSSAHTILYTAELGLPAISFSQSANVVIVSWVSIAMATHYEFRYKLRTSPNWPAWVNIGNVLSSNFTGEIQRQYDVQVRAYFQDDRGNAIAGESSEASYTTVREDPPGPVINLRHDGRFHWEWSPPNTGGRVWRYEGSLEAPWPLGRAEFSTSSTRIRHRAGGNTFEQGGYATRIFIHAVGPGGIGSQTEASYHRGQ